MSYEHELKSLEHKLKRAKQRRDDSLDGENEVDIEIAGNYVEEIEYQIGVYEKAQAFDALLHTYERYRHSHAHDLKLLLGMKVIELYKYRRTNK